LLFVDPEVEKRAQIEKEKLLKKKEVPMIRLKDGSLIPATALGGPAALTAQSIIGGEKTGIKSLV
jgi:hypothetical protein